MFRIKVSLVFLLGNFELSTVDNEYYENFFNSLFDQFCLKAPKIIFATGPAHQKAPHFINLVCSQDKAASTIRNIFYIFLN